MREVKFRVWDSSRCKYITEENRKDEEFEYLKDESYCNHAYLPIYLLENPYSPTLIYEQYTGLKDKHEEDELYQHDILKSFHFKDGYGKNHYLYHVIEWSNKYSCWMAISKSHFVNGALDSRDGNVQLWVLMKQDEYIGKCGNIHEGPTK